MSVPGKFHRSAGHTKRNCLQDRASFYRFRAWHILLIFNTAPCWTLDIRMSNIQLTSSSCISGNLSSSRQYHSDDVTMSLMASQITSLTIFYSTVYSGADQRKHQSSASLAFVTFLKRNRYIYSYRYRFKYRYTFHFNYWCRTTYNIYIYITVVVNQ